MANSLPPSDSNSQLLEAIKRLTLSITHGTVKAAGAVTKGVTKDLNMDMTKFVGSAVSAINPIVGSFTDKILEESKDELKSMAVSSYKHFKLGTSSLLSSTKSFFTKQKSDNVDLHRKMSLSSKSLTNNFKSQVGTNKALLRESTKMTSTTKGIVSAIDKLRKTNIQLMTMVARRLSKSPITAQEYNLLKPDISRFPHLATGGIVAKGGLAVVHNNEKITPSRVVDVQTAYLKRIAEASEQTSKVTYNKYSKRGVFSLEEKNTQKQTMMLTRLVEKFDFGTKLDQTLKSAELSNIAARKSFAESSMVRKLWRGLVSKPGESYAGTEGGQIIEELKGLRRSMGEEKKFTISDRIALTSKKILASMPFLEGLVGLAGGGSKLIGGTAKALGGGLVRGTNAALRVATGGSKDAGIFQVRSGNKYGRHVIEKGDPARTTANATVGIYEWQRIYGLQITDQLNNLLKRFGGKEETSYLTEFGRGSKKEVEELEKRRLAKENKTRLIDKVSRGLSTIKKKATQAKGFTSSVFANMQVKSNMNRLRPYTHEEGDGDIIESKADNTSILQKLLKSNRRNAKANEADYSVEKQQLELDKKKEKRSIWEKAKNGARTASANTAGQNLAGLGGLIKSSLIGLGSLISYIAGGKLLTKLFASKGTVSMFSGLATKLGPIITKGFGAVAITASAAIGYKFGEFLYKHFSWVRTVGDTIGKFVYNLPTHMKNLVLSTSTMFGTAIYKGFGWYVKTVKNMGKSLVSKLASSLETMIKGIVLLLPGGQTAVKKYEDHKIKKEENKLRDTNTSIINKLQQDPELKASYKRIKQERYGGGKITADQTNEIYGDALKQKRDGNVQKKAELAKIQSNPALTEEERNRQIILNSDPEYLRKKKKAQEAEARMKNEYYAKSKMLDPMSRVGSGIKGAAQAAGHGIKQFWNEDKFKKGTYYNAVKNVGRTIGRGVGGMVYGGEGMTDYSKNNDKDNIRQLYSDTAKRGKELQDKKGVGFLQYTKDALDTAKKQATGKYEALLEVSGKWYTLSKDGVSTYVDNQEQIQLLKGQVVAGKLRLITVVKKGELIIGKGQNWIKKHYDGGLTTLSKEKSKAIITTLKSKYDSTKGSFIQNLNNILPTKDQIKNSKSYQDITRMAADGVEALEKGNKNAINKTASGIIYAQDNLGLAKNTIEESKQYGINKTSDGLINVKEKGRGAKAYIKDALDNVKTDYENADGGGNGAAGKVFSMLSDKFDQLINKNTEESKGPVIVDNSNKTSQSSTVNNNTTQQQAEFSLSAAETTLKVLYGVGI